MSYFLDTNIKSFSDGQLQERIVKLQKMKDHYLQLGAHDQIKQAELMLQELIDEFRERTANKKPSTNGRSKLRKRDQQQATVKKDETINFGTIEQRDNSKDDEWN